MTTIAFFNNKGGVGKTSLVYHLAWMFSEHGLRTLAIDLDPQSNLTSMFLDDRRLEELWDGDDHPQTVYGAIRPILRGIGDIAQPHLEKISDTLSLISGDLGLSRFEDKLSASWPLCQNRDESAFRTMTSFYRLALLGEKECDADIVLLDVGPNLGAINRAALIAADSVVVPLAADLFSLQGLRNLGPTMREWREIWRELLAKAPKGLEMPKGLMTPIGYVVSQHGVVESNPVKSYQSWVQRIPKTFRESVLGNTDTSLPEDTASDPYVLAMLKHYRSLMPMAMNAHKPMFFLKSADGAIGAHVEAVHACYEDFFKLSERIKNKLNLTEAGNA